ncbi:hypothetical protein BDV09DRAFT_34154 [Aspergillus tetrazonus]
MFKIFSLQRFLPSNEAFSNGSPKTRDWGGVCVWRLCLWDQLCLFCFFSTPPRSAITGGSLHSWTWCFPIILSWRPSHLLVAQPSWVELSASLRPLV